jgi:predicted dehydrogenase
MRPDDRTIVGGKADANPPLALYPGHQGKGSPSRDTEADWTGEAMIVKDARCLRIGVLGCGPIAQAAHFDAVRKARNADLHAICDRADELRERMAAVHRPRVAYRDYDDMLADPEVDAVIIAIADEFHVRAARAALEAGKHVLVEKPLGTTVESCRELRDHAAVAGRVVQVGNNRRFDPGIEFARRFIGDELGGRMAIKAWYHDSLYRYAMTDNLQPIPVTGAFVLRPEGDPKADRRRYYLLTHGSHLVDTARMLGGSIAGLRARLLERFEAFCWFVSIDYEDGTLGHLDLQIPVRGDFQEGFQVFGERGSVNARVHLPWFHKSSEVDCFSTRDRQFRRVLGEDAHTYKRQVEAFAATILDGAPQAGADLEDGLAAMQAMAAIARSVESGEFVRLADVTGGP